MAFEKYTAGEGGAPRGVPHAQKRLFQGHNASGEGMAMRLERLKLGLTQADLGELVGLKQGDVSDAELGRAAPQVVQKLREALGMGLPTSPVPPPPPVEVTAAAAHPLSSALQIPEGATKAELGPCPHCGGTGKAWRFFP